VATVALVEDDLVIASAVVRYLRHAGHDVVHVTDGLGALDLAAPHPPDLMLLDVMLPGLDGIEVCRRMRACAPAMGIVMLTALGAVDDRIAGLAVGADDYVTKPFSLRELMLRVESVLRRLNGVQNGLRPLRAGDIEIDPVSRRATRSGQELTLTVREFDLLAFFLAHPGVAFAREQLLREVWGWTFGDRSTVTVHVRRLREKIEPDPARPSLIQTIYGVGYRFDAPITSPPKASAAWD
jgi:DNA-binding response OmpR family regulator